MSAPDPASAWRSHTGRQARHAAARFDREARAAVTANRAKQTAQNVARHVVIARRYIDLMTRVALTGRTPTRAITREEHKAIKESLQSHWRTLRHYAGDIVTVLS